MKKTIAIFILLGVSFGAGFYVGALGETEPANSMNADMQEHEHMAMGGHMHDSLELADHDALPAVGLMVHKDPISGWNAQLIVSNFRFAPEHASTEFVAGEGHAHIYVDGVKISRVYGEWYYLGELTPGMHEVSVQLSSNDHKELTHDGEPIGDTVMVDVR